MLRSSDLDWTRARSRNDRGHQFLRPQLDTVIPTAGITGLTAMFAYTPVLGNDALGIPLALVRGHCRHPARITKCPLDATSITSSKEPHHQSRKVICVGHVRSAGTTSVAERGCVRSRGLSVSVFASLRAKLRARLRAAEGRQRSASCTSGNRRINKRDPVARRRDDASHKHDIHTDHDAQATYILHAGREGMRRKEYVSSATICM